MSRDYVSQGALQAQADKNKTLDAINQSGSEMANNFTQLAKTMEEGKQKRQTQDSATNNAMDLQQAKQAQDIKSVQGLKDLGLGGRSIKAGEIAVGEQPPVNPMLALREDKQLQDKAENLSKRYEKSSGFLSALQELDAKTNKDGQGGVLTNPKAQIPGTGKVESALPSSLIGVGELVGAVPKGTSDSRKSLERLQLEYQKATAGMRQTDQLRKQERSAMGFIASGDPDLVAKGIRSLAKNVKNTLQIQQAGYDPRVLDRVHSAYGNPVEALGNIHDDNAPQPQDAAMQQQAPSGGVSDFAAAAKAELERRKAGK